MNHIKLFEDWLNESVTKDPSSATLQDCKAIFTSYANVTNNKSSLVRLHKRRNDPFVSEVLKEQLLPTAALYRGIKLYENKSYAIGEKVEFGFDGWSEDEKIASNFAHTKNGTGVVFAMEKPAGLFINLKTFGDSLEHTIESIRPNWNFKDPDLTKVYAEAKKDPLIEKLNEVYAASLIGKYGRGESETITEPQTLTVKRIEEGSVTKVYVE